MVAPIDSPKIVTGGPGAKIAAPPAKPCGEPKLAGDGLSLSKPGEGPVIGQTSKIEGGKIHTSDTVKLDAEPERVMAALEGDWSAWWPNGKVEDVPAGVALPRPEENERRFLFRELGAKGQKGSAYVVRQLMPTAEQAGGGALMMVIPTKLAGELTGDGRFEIRVTPDGKTLLTAKWDGVKQAKPSRFGAGAEGVAKAHLAHEKQALEHLGVWLKAHP